MSTWRKVGCCLAFAAGVSLGASADYVVTNSLRDVVVRQWMDRDLPHVDSLGTWNFTTQNRGAMSQGANLDTTWIGLKNTDYPYIYANVSGVSQTVGNGTVPPDAIRCHSGRDSGKTYVSFTPKAAGTYRVAITTWALDRGSVLVSADNGAGTLLSGTETLNTAGSTTPQSTVSDWLTLGTEDTVRLVIDCNGSQDNDGTGLFASIQQLFSGAAPAEDPYKPFRYALDCPATSNVAAGARSALAAYVPPTTVTVPFTAALKAARMAEANPVLSDALLGSWRFQTRGGKALVNWTGSAEGPTAGLGGTKAGETYPWISGNITDTDIVGGLAVGAMHVHPDTGSDVAMNVGITPAKTGQYRIEYRARRENLAAYGNGVRVSVMTDEKSPRTLGAAVDTPSNGAWVGSDTGWRRLAAGEAVMLNVDSRSNSGYDETGLTASLSYRALPIESCSLADFIRAAYYTQANPVTSNALFGTWTMKQKNGGLLSVSSTEIRFLPASGQQYQHFSATASGDGCSMHPPSNDTASHVIAFAADKKGLYRLVVRARSATGQGNGVKVTAYGATTDDALGTFTTTTDKAWGVLTTAWRQLEVGDTLHLQYDNNGSDGNDSTDTAAWVERSLGETPPLEEIQAPVPTAFTNGSIAVSLGWAPTPGGAFTPFDGFADDRLPWYVWNCVGRDVPKVLANTSGEPLADETTGIFYEPDELRLCPGPSRLAVLRIEMLSNRANRRCDLDFELRCPSDGTSLMSLGEACYVYVNGVETDATWLRRDDPQHLVRRVSGLKKGDVVELHVKSCPPADQAVSSDEVAARVIVRKERIPGLTVLVR